MHICVVKVTVCFLLHDANEMYQFTPQESRVFCIRLQLPDVRFCHSDTQQTGHQN